MAAAVVVGVAGLATLGGEVGRARPLTLAPRVAAIALLVLALVQPWLASATGLTMRLRGAIFVGLAGLGVALLASVAVVALRARRGWVIAGLAAWTIGWVASTADLSAAIAAALGGSAPLGPHQLRELDAALVQILATAGGVAIGAAIASSFPEPRARHSAIVLVVGYAVFGVLVARAEHGIALATDFPGLVAQREQRDLAEAIRSFALAGLMWQCWRRGPRAAA